MSEKVITISAKEYAYLKDREFFLNCLEAAGVDNWCGYECAWEMYEEGKKED